MVIEFVVHPSQLPIKNMHTANLKIYMRPLDV